MRRTRRLLPAHQRGWAGLLVLLVTLVVVGFLARTVLKQMGVADRGAVPITPGSPAAGSAAAPAPAEGGRQATPIERARAVEADVLRSGKALDERLQRVER